MAATMGPDMTGGFLTGAATAGGLRLRASALASSASESPWSSPSLSPLPLASASSRVCPSPTLSAGSSFLASIVAACPPCTAPWTRPRIIALTPSHTTSMSSNP
ncbi:hypothetical protein BCR44DRAFT_1439496 [Catenaria anguillulae PL171]|uniref:Uncharacterized protein n=1 Tax=Catenaria anguillulae PL171 TaxID=765915 RepID=A0A1Y2HDS6_9FUNG|nr:hypothetical protein BCR44DRAFT_1439496 [Catenaria anguillulae PL171]